MEKLRNEQARLSEWLSEDSEYILEQCGDILTMNDCKAVLKQTDEQEKTIKLLEIILNKGEDTCQSFIAILKQHQAHYKHLQQFFSPSKDGSVIPKVYSDQSGLVSVNKVNKATGKNYSNTVTIFSGGNSSSGTKTQQLPQADYIATDNSAILADVITDSNFDTITFSTVIKPAQPAAGTVGDIPELPQGPLAKMITAKKVELIDCLRGDRHILQHVHAKQIITNIQYQNLTHGKTPAEAANLLIDLVTGRGEEICQQFIEILKIPDVLKTYPQLRKILNIEA